MARDYKRTRKSAKKKKNESSPWMFLAYGFALGLIAALALYLHLRPVDILPPDRPVPNTASTPQSSSDSENEPTGSVTPVPATSTAETKTPAPQPAPADSKYAFYDLLPDQEIVVSDENAQPVTRQSESSRPQRPAETPGKPATYILQAGSFRKFVDADRRKAELAFKGIESNIQRVVLKEEEIWYRVYVGPGNDFAAFEKMRSDLRRSNIDVLILRARQ